MNNNNPLQQQLVRVPFSLSVTCSANQAPKGYYLPDPASSCRFPASSSDNTSSQNETGLVLKRKNKLGRRANSFANPVNEHGKLGRKISETVRRKLRLGARILQNGGIEKIYKRLFSVNESERLLKVLQCYLSTTAGPVSGLLFISTEKIAFCSERSVKITSPNGELIRILYKVSIPLSKVRKLDQCVDTKKATQRYIEVVTVDGFDFWFMDFLNHQKAFRYLQHAISRCSDNVY